MNSQSSKSTNAGCRLALRRVLCALLFVFALPLRGDTGSGDSSLFTVDARYGLSLSSGTSGLFLADTRSPGNAGRAESSIFTTDTRSALTASAVVNGRVTSTVTTPTFGEFIPRMEQGITPAGSSLSGATVSALQNNRVVASVNTDGSGNYVLPALPPGAYELRATRLNYLTGLRQGLVLNANQNIRQDFALKPRPASPASQVVTRTPELTQAPAPSTVASTQLKVFSGGQFVTGGSVNPNKPTVVMTHGWNSDPDVWAKAMAGAMVSSGADANICAWDWRTAAGTGITDTGALGRAVERIPDQAEALAQALGVSLGGTQYRQPVHFIGHSLGTLVNGLAANILHGDAPWKAGSQVFDPSRTHMTLLDDAELAVSKSFDDFYSPIPRRYAWADNYFTYTGRYRPNAVNAYLGRGHTLNPDPRVAHGYPCVWYRLSVANPLGSILGYRFSFEKTGSFAPFPTPAPFAYGTFLKQDPSPFVDELSLLVPVTPEEVADLIAKNAVLFAQRSYQSGVSIVQSTIQFAGSVVANVTEKLFSGGNEGDAVYLSNPEYTTPAYFNSTPLPPVVTPDWSVSLNLSTGPAIFIGPQSAPSRISTSSVRLLGDPQPAPTNTPAYVWMTVTLPTNTTSLSFDFIYRGNGSNDSLAAGINGTNIFSLATRFMPTDVPLNSGALDVSRYAGQTVEMFFGVVGGTSTNANLTVDGIRFYQPVSPTLQAAKMGSQATVTWPVSAPDFVLESTPSLTGTNQWSAVTNALGVLDFQYRLTNDAAGVRFFRLRKP